MDTAIPDTPANAILVDPEDGNRVYVGTDLGVFRTLDGGITWTDFNVGMPHVPVYDLVASLGAQSVVAYTYGRGAYRLDLACASDTTPCPGVGETIRAAKGASV